MSIFKVSHSKLKTWKSCRMAYHYKYKERLRKKTKSRPLAFGGLFHELMEKYEEGEDPFEYLDELREKSPKLFKEEVELYGDLYFSMRVIFSEYLDYYKDQPLKPVRINKKWAEHEFNLEIENGLVLTGKIDMLAKLPSGQVALVERKTFDRMPSSETRWKNVQAMTYAKVIQLLDWADVSVVLWDYIHSKQPSVPYILKAGGFSTKACVTLPSVVEMAAKENGIKLKKTDLVYTNAVRSRNDYFQRIVVPLRQPVIDSVFEETLTAAKALRAQHEDKPFRTIDRHCDWCDYKDLCQADLTGGDPEFLKERLYTVETKTNHPTSISRAEKSVGRSALKTTRKKTGHKQ